jgi:hypothetical protein
MATPRLSQPGLIYVTAVIAAGTLAVVASLFEMYSTPVGYQWFILAALTVLSGSATVKLPSVPASLSVSETFVFTSVILFGAPAGTLTVALDGLIISLWLNKRRKELHRVLFNMAAPALSIWVAAQLFYFLSGLRPLAQDIALPNGVAAFLWPLFAFTVVFFLLNTWLISFAVAFETGGRPLVIWRENFLWLSLNFFCGASVAALLTLPAVRTRHLTQSFDGTAVLAPGIDLTDFTYLGAIIPLLLVLYVTYRTAMARVADANEHLTQMNTMYLSTIEALAMAVDAKDQVTHGHIRRVQQYTTGLARALGISDGGLFRAIEAASLLHDMGKLAVPEHILNKPGRLTPAEFERMKLHAGIGADILASIRFPYPVIPIVRHHHENWDGSGYPDGLRGTEIPLGARILSVVDCYDALTSDRPYRRRLSSEEAISILLERRGGMYDPLVVDAFIRELPELLRAEATPESVETHPELMELTRAIAKNRSAITPDAPHGGELAVVQRAVSLARSISASTRRLPFDAKLNAGGDRLLRSLHADLLIVYAYSLGVDELRARLTIPFMSDLQGFVVRRGERLSGWVAAHRASVNNASPHLELPEGLVANLRSALSVPLLLGDVLVGAVTIFSHKVNGFSLQDQRTCEIVAPHIAAILAEEVIGISEPTLLIANERAAGDLR